jgi:NADH-quinone oxidoreductase subunit L
VGAVTAGSLLLAAEGGHEPFSHVTTAAPGSVIDLAWLIPVVPAVMAGVLLLLGRRTGRPAAALAIGAMGFGLAMSVLVLRELLALPADARQVVVEVAPWLDVAGLQVDWSLLVDPLSAVLLLLVTGVGLLVHVYSLGYMASDPRYERFFAYLNLFAASMLVLVLGSSFLVLFVGWELVGLSSYLLIGFWFDKPAYAAAAKKAFVTNRIGDVGFMVAMFVVLGAFGSLEFAEVLPRAGEVGTGVLVAVGLLLLVAATGKSAQIPLYVWLPDAMAGPTPVSALIHAATMVTAGVYLIARTSPLYAAVPDVGLLVAYVGGITAFVAAAIACAQVDLKKVLAYSTVSQLGYMFIGVGVGDHTAGIFHLLTHGFFKALLFLAAGSVMHAMGDRTDVREMGGLWRAMPITGTTALVGVAAIAGMPPLSGFYSKEEVLAAAAETPGAEALWLLGLLVAALTAFYMVRWFVLIFLGPARWHGLQGAHGPVHPHESPPSMTLPLVVLAVASAAGGVLNLDPETGWLHGWLAGVVAPFEHAETWIPESAHLPAALAAAALGVALSVAMYRRVDVATVGVPTGLRGIAARRFYVDEAYELFTVRIGGALARGLARADGGGIDGLVDGSAALVGGVARRARRTQTGYVRAYALGILAGTAFLGVLVAAAYLQGVRS